MNETTFWHIELFAGNKKRLAKVGDVMLVVYPWKYPILTIMNAYL